MNTPLDVLRREYDKIERFTLPNGMECILKTDQSAPVISVQFWVGCGSMHEEQFLGCGISHAVEHMLFKGTATRAPGDVTREINEAGGAVNAYTSLDRTVYFADLPSANWRTGFDVLSDAVMNASFPEAEWALERNVILREVSMGEDSPERVLNKMLWQNVFRTDPRRHPVIGYTDTFSALTRADLVTYFQRHYTSDNMALVIVGDMDSARVHEYITTALSAMKRRPRMPVSLPVEPPQVSPRFARVQGNYEIGRLAAAWPGVTLHHPDAAALDILTYIAGQGRSSRLYRSLVEDRKLVDSISSWSYSPGQSGLIGLQATFDAKQEDAAVAAILQEVEYLKSVPFTPQELAKAVRSFMADLLGGLETMNGQASRFGGDLYATGDPRFSEFYFRQVGNVSPDDLLRVAREYLTPSRQTLVLLVPESKASTEPMPLAEVAKPATALTETTLKNGATLIVQERPRLPFVYIAVALQGGVRTESADKNGMTTLMADLLMRGTASRSRDEIAQTIESLGASLNTYAGYNAFGLTGRCLSSDTETVLKLLADCLLNPLFEESEIARQRDLQSAAIRRQAEQPTAMARQQLRALLFPDHPYRFAPEGSLDTVAGISRDDLVAYHRMLTVSGNLAITIFGDISNAEATRLAEAAFASLPSGERPTLTHRPAPPALPARAVKDMPREQAIVMMGFPGVTVYDPQQDVLNVMQTALSGLSSELALEIRDRRGLAYFTGAMQQVGIDPGAFMLYAGTHCNAVAEVESLFVAEIRRLSEQGLREDEINRAKAQLIANHAMRMQDAISVAQECALNACYGIDTNYIFTFPDRIAAVSPEDIRKIAGQLLVAGKQAVSIVLPAAAKVSGE